MPKGRRSLGNYIGTSSSLGIKKVTSYIPASVGSISNPATSSVQIQQAGLPTGWYYITLNGVTNQYWVDMEYSGGGWVCVLSHPINTSITDNGSNVTYTKSTSGNAIISASNSAYATGNPSNTTFMASLGIWSALATANNSGKNIACYVSNSYAALGSTGSHARRSRWTWTGWSSTYAWQGVANLSNEVGGTAPGLHSYHITGGYSWTSYDVDQDVYTSNCSTLYNNAPWWYGACWDGSYWGGNGNGYQNAVFWTGSGTDYYNYGAIYVK